MGKQNSEKGKEREKKKEVQHDNNGVDVNPPLPSLILGYYLVTNLYAIISLEFLFICEGKKSVIQMSGSVPISNRLLFIIPHTLIYSFIRYLINKNNMRSYGFMAKKL